MRVAESMLASGPSDVAVGEGCWVAVKVGAGDAVGVSVGATGVGLGATVVGAGSVVVAGGTVAVTNAQANSVWSPVAVLLAYRTPATGSVAVARISGGVEYALGSHEAAGATGLVWVADAPYPFAAGDVLVVRSPETNGTAQVILSGQ